MLQVPTISKRMMNDILGTFITSFVVVQLDNILFFSKTWDEHMCHIEQVFDTHMLYTNMKKCSFAKREIHYLGYIIDA